jgi:hypothetical protein
MLRRHLRRNPLVPTTSTDPTVFARARPRLVRLEERYRYRQKVAPHSTVARDEDQPPSGLVEIVTPYDGHEHVTRVAVADVERRLRTASAAETDVDALIGHLVLVNHQDTDLASRLALDGRFGAHGIRLPVRNGDLADATALTDGALQHRLVVDYEPREDVLEYTPITVDVSLSDPDYADSDRDLIKAITESDTRQLALGADAIKQFVGFKPHLRLAVTVRLTLPPLGPDDVEPILRRVAVRLPGALSLSRASLRLSVGGLGHPIQYESEDNELVWFDVPMRDDDRTKESPRKAGEPAGPRRRMSRRMLLRFEQPGELHALDKLVVSVDAEVPGELLSGTRARLFDARGYQIRESGPLKLRSVVSTTCEISLSHVFRRRVVSPHQSFHFGEIVPGKLRITDIHAALVDQRFEVEEPVELSAGEEKNQMARYLLGARRSDGPDEVKLFVVVEGQRQSTRRETRDSRSSTNVTKFISGDLWLFVRGEAPRDARTVTHEINKLQRTLRERFGHHRVPR